MDFETANRVLTNLSNESVSRRHPGRLERMRAFLRLLGDPQEAFRSIHIGGTAGKGSTATMCASIMHAAGHRVGLHVKPHLRNVTERARIDGAPIDEERFAALLSDMLPAIDRMAGSEHGKPSYFEVTVALAFVLFTQERVDVAVIEVGVGGSLDGTNVVTPLASVITNVGLDHTEVLGDTIEKIATDKAGIIKPSVPVITAAEDIDALRVIRTKAKASHAPLRVVGEDARIELLPNQMAYAQTLRVTTAMNHYEAVMPLLGEFQLTNAATAILACEAAMPAVSFEPKHVSAGLGEISLPGRMEFHPSRPSLVFDVAHNAEKARALRGALERHFPSRRMIFVVSIAEGKDAQGMLDALCELPAQFIFTQFHAPHRQPAQPRVLASMAQSNGATARAVEDPAEALTVARRIAGSLDLVVVTGSTYLVAELRDWFLEHVEAHGHAAV